ncbi:hypothetical protein Tco_0269869 [Tanacetum coccineum]
MFKCVRPLAGKIIQKEFRSVGWCKENRVGQKTVAEDKHPCDTKVLNNEVGNPSREYQTSLVGINPLVHSFRALSTLRRSGLRTASAAAKPCQGDSLEFYLITSSIYTD